MTPEFCVCGFRNDHKPPCRAGALRTRARKVMTDKDEVRGAATVFHVAKGTSIVVLNRITIYRGPTAEAVCVASEVNAALADVLERALTAEVEEKKWKRRCMEVRERAPKDLGSLEEALRAAVCPRDTNGDGNCGQRACPVCKARDPLMQLKPFATGGIVTKPVVGLLGGGHGPGCCGLAIPPADGRSVPVLLPLTGGVFGEADAPNDGEESCPWCGGTDAHTDGCAGKP